jgi:rare lipoprotein A
LCILALFTFSGGLAYVAAAKTPGNKYCFYGTCHRVKTITETEALIGVPTVLKASFYDSCARDSYNPCGLTSSGEAFNPDRPDNAASPIYPDGTKLLVWSSESKEALVLRVNNAGPYWGDRELDVSRAAAEVLGFKDRGVADLHVSVLEAPTLEEATYRQDRTYDPVPGQIGQYQTASAAHAGLRAVLALEATASTVSKPATATVVAALGDAIGAVFPDLPEAEPAVEVPDAKVFAQPVADAGGSDDEKPAVRGTAPEPATTKVERRSRRVAAKSPARLASGRSRAAKTVRMASASGSKTRSRGQASTIVTASAAPAALAKAPAITTVAGAPNDSLSVFSRHGPMGLAAEGRKLAAQSVAAPQKRASLRTIQRSAGLGRRTDRRHASVRTLPSVQIAALVRGDIPVVLVEQPSLRMPSERPGKPWKGGSFEPRRGLAQSDPAGALGRIG